MRLIDYKALIATYPELVVKLLGLNCDEEVFYTTIKNWCINDMKKPDTFQERINAFSLVHQAYAQLEHIRNWQKTFWDKD